MRLSVEPAAEQAWSGPFPGLRPYTREEHALFFGRGEQIDQMLTSLEEVRFLAVVGSSGCGKSSLVRAGLLPAITDGFLTVPWEDPGEEIPPWRFVQMRPGNAPFTRLAEAIQDSAWEEREGALDPEATALTEATLRSGLRGFLDAIADAGVEGKVPVLLLVDQFEEIFRLSDRAREGEEGERREASVRDETMAFVNLLLHTSRAIDRPIQVVITMRSDWIGRCDSFPGLPEAVSNGQFLTPRMTRDQLREAITGPLSLFGASPEPALVNRVLNEMGNEMDQLPLMQHALMRTWHTAEDRWQKSGEERVLTVADYDRVGGFSEALSRHLEEAWAELREDDREERIVRHLFLLLSEPGKAGGALTRRMATTQEVVEVAETDVAEIKKLVDVFRRANRNFIVISPSGEIDEKTVFDISHEALLRQWARLQKWVTLEGESAILYAEILKAARRWEKGGASPWRPPELDVARKWRARAKPSPVWARRYGGRCELVTSFLDWSEQELRKGQDLELKNRRRGLLLKFGGGLLVVLLAVLTAMGFLYREAKNQRAVAESQRVVADTKRKEARKNLALSHARELAWTAMGELDRDGERAILLAMESALAWPGDLRNELPGEIETALRKTFAEAWLGTGFEGHHKVGTREPAKLYSIDLDSEGKRAVSSSRWTEGKARVWEVATGKELAVLDHARSADDGETSRTTVSGVVFSPDGQRILTTTWRDGGYAYIWDGNLAEREPALPAPFEGHFDWVMGGDFHPREPWVATGSYCRKGKERAGQEILIWNHETRELVEAPAGGRLFDARKYGVAPADMISSVTFRPTDGQRLLSTCFDGSVFIWNLEPKDPEAQGDPAEEGPREGEEAAEGEGPEAGPSLERWSKKEISEGVFRYEDGTIEIRAAHGMDGDEMERVWDGDFSPDGKLIATVGNDYFLRIWEAETGRLLSKQRHNDSILQVVFTDRDHVATACNDLVVRIWKLEWIPLEPSRDKSMEAGLDGAALALQQSGELRGHRGWIRGLARSDGSGVLATASEDGSARIWTPPPRAEVAWIQSPEAEYWCAAIHVRPPEGERKQQVLVYCGTSDGEVHLYDGATGALVQHPVFQPGSTLHANRLRSLAVNSDGSRLLTSSNDTTAILWEARTGRRICVIDAHSGMVEGLEAAPVYKARFSRDGQRVVTAGGDGVARIWNLSDLESGRVGPASSVTLELPGKDAQGRKLERVVFDARFSPDGKRVVTADFTGDTVSIWDAASGKRLHVLKPGRHMIMSASFSPDGEEVAAASMDGNCYVWSSGRPEEEPRLLKKLEHSGGVRSVDYGPHREESILLTGASDGAAKFWDRSAARRRSDLRRYPQVITDASFSNDGKFVVTSSAGGPVRISYADAWSVYGIATLRVTRKLSVDERKSAGVRRELTAKERPYYEQAAQKTEQAGE